MCCLGRVVAVGRRPVRGGPPPCPRSAATPAGQPKSTAVGRPAAVGRHARDRPQSAVATGRGRPGRHAAAPRFRWGAQDAAVRRWVRC